MKLTGEISSELWEAIRRSYESAAWSNAILDAVYFVSDAIRSKTGLQSDGTALVGQAFGGKAPKLRLNRLETESEQSIQSGVEQLFRGIYQAFRNPRSHGRIEDSQLDADAIIIFLDHLLRIIGHARAEFSLDTSVARILDKNFVPNVKYAELLLEEIPTRQRIQVALTVYQQKRSGDGEKLRFFFNAAIANLLPEEQLELFSAASRELRETTDDSVVRAALQCIHPDYWPRIDQIARMRVENRILQSINEGRYDVKRKNTSAGWLATWVTGFLRHFTLRDEVYYALLSKLRSKSKTEQDYVFEYFFGSIDSLREKPTDLLQSTIAEGLEVGDDRFRNAVESLWLWQDEQWSERVRTGLANFQSVRPASEIDDDEVPF
jgi:uncharacterized protein (TIGR02391 family)